MIASRASNRGLTLTELLFVLAIGATLLAVGTPVLRGALGEQRLQSGAVDISSAMAEARRQAVRSNADTRVEVDPADGRISVFARNTATNFWEERRRVYLPDRIVFNELLIITNYGFDSLGRPATLPMSITIRAVQTGETRTVTVLGSGQINIT
jgi:prepilin-type N-terminal cleavage/methylation domain-containing protein